jgi:hypothetical protein
VIEITQAKDGAKRLQPRPHAIVSGNMRLLTFCASRERPARPMEVVEADLRGAA